MIIMFCVYVLRDGLGWLRAHDGPAVWAAHPGHFALIYLSYRFVESPFLKIKPE